MRKKEKLKFILEKICIIKMHVALGYIVCILVMGLSPVMQLAVMEKMIGELSEKRIKEGILFIVLEGVMFITISMIDNISELTNHVMVLKIQHNTKTVIAKKMKSIDLEFLDNPELLDLYQNSLTQADSSITEMVHLITIIITLIVSFSGYTGLIFSTNKFAIFIILITTLPMIILKIHFKKIYYSFRG